MTSDKDEALTYVEHNDVEAARHDRGAHSKNLTEVTGTVQLTEGTVVYIPTPTADPRDPLNMGKWQKTAILVVISTFSVLGLSIISGFGGVLGFYIPAYIAMGKSEADIVALMTWPNLFMGIGNLLGMPIAYAVGRRVVLLFSTVILVITAALCAAASTTNYNYLLWARCAMGLAAGQSEALVPMIAQLAVQVTLTTVWVLFASPIAGAITPEWWYGLGAILAGVQFVLTFLLVPETKYNRPLAAYQEGSDGSSSVEYCTKRPPIDSVNYPPRTWKSNLALWVGEPEWEKAWSTFRQSFELLIVPQVFWAMTLNGLALAINVGIGTTYGNIITLAPYNWPQSSTSYLNCGQIITALVALPFFGRGSDMLIKWFANRRGGVHEPEVRLIPLILPIVVGIITSTLYGQGFTHPDQYHWFVYAWALAAFYFTFVGVNIVSITYLLDSYPSRTGPILIIICAFRGFISFGIDYPLAQFTASYGYDGAFGIFAGLLGVVGLFGVPIYIWGKKLRLLTGPLVKKKGDE
ncbi:MFS general substrate transporter [Thozetella sp. PMI_491]|nr:MFS general substrate transporter [Thozetella sp. PMI_491]